MYDFIEGLTTAISNASKLSLSWVRKHAHENRLCPWESANRCVTLEHVAWARSSVQALVWNSKTIMHKEKVSAFFLAPLLGILHTRINIAAWDRLSFEKR